MKYLLIIAGIASLVYLMNRKPAADPRDQQLHGFSDTLSLAVNGDTLRVKGWCQYKRFVIADALSARPLPDGQVEICLPANSEWSFDSTSYQVKPCPAYGSRWAHCILPDSLVKAGLGQKSIIVNRLQYAH